MQCISATVVRLELCFTVLLHAPKAAKQFLPPSLLLLLCDAGVLKLVIGVVHAHMLCHQAPINPCTSHQQLSSLFDTATRMLGLSRSETKKFTMNYAKHYIGSHNVKKPTLLLCYIVANPTAFYLGVLQTGSMRSSVAPPISMTPKPRIAWTLPQGACGLLWHTVDLTYKTAYNVGFVVAA